VTLISNQGVALLRPQVTRSIAVENFYKDRELRTDLEREPAQQLRAPRA
jgi:hypothetical protein